jgi:ATP-dependent Clp protease ATP-binding subunit ClpB
MQYLIRGDDYLARTPKFKLVDRVQDLERLSSILLRSNSNSVLLVGPGGVGCTALIMGLQASKRDPNAPFDIVSKRLFWLDTDGLFSLGDAQKVNESFQKLMGILYRTPESILIIEDTRDFIEAARNIGSLHFVNALTLAIKSHKTQVILEARDEDLDVILKAHSDMRELFTMLDLQEPIGEALAKIVTAQSEDLQDYHKIRIAPDAITAAIELTTKYRARDAGISRAQPERSVALLDRALSSYRLMAHRSPPGLAAAEAAVRSAAEGSDKIAAEGVLKKLCADWEANQAEIKVLYKRQRDGEQAVLDLEAELEKQVAQEAEAREKGAATVEVQKASSSIAKFASLATGANIDSAAVSSIKRRINEFQAEIEKNKIKFDELTRSINEHLELTREFVLKEFSAISGIPANKLNEDEREKLKGLEAGMKRRIFGQDHAVKRLADAIKTARIGRRNQDKPQASFMFLGPSGVGKTEIAKAVSEVLLGDDKALTRFDMSEYMEKHAVARLIGAPPGYEGFEAGGILTNAMRKNPVRVLLFDEIEKAHPDVFNVFLQILSDGRLTDNVGRTVSFADSIIIMTTNLGQPHFLDTSLTFEEAGAAAMEEVGKTYRSEFLNRFNGRENIVPFNRLGLDSIERIVRREFDGLNNTYAQEGIEVAIADEELKKFCAAKYDPAVGARGLPGTIQTTVEPIIVDMILENRKQSVAHFVYDDAAGRLALVK